LPRLSVLCSYMEQYVTNIAVNCSLLRKQSYKTNNYVEPDCLGSEIIKRTAKKTESWITE
jgi:hypothetical protein